MRFTKFRLTVLLSILFFKMLSAQSNLSEGYYIDLKHDTIHGFFNFDDLFVNKVLFSENKTTAPFKVLVPEQIRQIETLDNISITSFLYAFKDQKEPLFLSKFANGNVQLYRGKSFNADEGEVFFISSVKIPDIKKITRSNPKIFLNTYFKGCELGNSWAVVYSQNSILKAVNALNNCAYPNNKIVENAAKTYPVKVAFGFKGGLFVNNSNTKYLFGERKTKSITKPIFGLILAFDITNSVKFYTGINYFKRILIASEVLNTTQLPIFTFSTTNFEIPFEFHFELNKMKRAYIPEIIGGMTLVIPSNPLSDGQYSVTNYYKNKFINASYCVGGGIKKILKDKASAGLYLKLTFDNENPIGIGRIYSTRLEASLNYVFPSSKK